jgi:hypothetical protein
MVGNGLNGDPMCQDGLISKNPAGRALNGTLSARVGNASASCEHRPSPVKGTDFAQIATDAHK